MLNASVGVQRAIARLRPDVSQPRRAPRAQRQGARAARAVQAHLHGRPRARQLDLSAGLARARRARLSPDRIVPVGVAGLVLVASFLSFLPEQASGAVGGTQGTGQTPRIAIGGGFGIDRSSGFAIDGSHIGLRGALLETEETPRDEFHPLVAPGPIDLIPDPVAPAPAAAADAELTGPFLADGTLVAGFAPDTTIADGKDQFRRYRVRSGDTLTGIASRFDVSMMTIWWANNLKAKDDLHVGQWLTIPPASGLVVTVKVGDTLDTLAAAHKADKAQILEINGLDDPNLVVGQTLLMPGALGEAIATPKPKPVAPRATSGGSRSRSGSGGGGGGSVRPPTRYSGGSMSWPVVGGGNYISQYYRYGHYGIDIAADYGSRVRAAASGRVIFAGWKSNGGGYQVWIAHGSGLYTTYNHMSGVSVGRGQTVSKGQAVGRIGCSGWCTGPHLHFEVWRGEVWSGGRRVNPLSYL